jgi:hypothetical protein
VGGTLPRVASVGAPIADGGATNDAATEGVA